MTFSRQLAHARWVLAATLLVVIPASVGHAQDVWVKSKAVKLTLRTGAGTQYRIIGGLQTGDAVKIIRRVEGWTQVATSEGKEGWVSAGFLDPQPPAVVALENLENETAALRSEVAALTEEVAALKGSNENLISKDDGQRSEVDRLTRENYELRAGARWPEWITGGAIVLLGMALGAILSRSSGRRQKRIRL
jgi:SH3 domain protein